MQGHAGWEPASQLPSPDEPAGNWEYREFSERLYGRVKFHTDSWPPERELPTHEMLWLVGLGVRRLITRVGRSGWSPAEPADALSLWRSERVEFTVKAVGLVSGRYEVSFLRLSLQCGRPVRSDSPD